MEKKKATTMNAIFESTIRACQSNKDSKVSKKRSLKESKVLPKNNKKLKEDIDEIEVKEKETEVEPEGMTDDIVIVTDPELDTDNFDKVISAAQQIVDDTPEGEVPMSDEYVGDKVYQCPICGNNFFSDEDMTEGDACPVCGETPDGFVLNGEVEEADKADDDKEDKEDEESTDEVEIDETETEVEESAHPADCDCPECTGEKKDKKLKKTEERFKRKLRDSKDCKDCKECNDKKESSEVSKDLSKYQRWVDYDMKHYGKISGRTDGFLKKAGLEVVKDDHGDYEVIAKEESVNRSVKSISKKESITRRPIRRSPVLKIDESTFNPLLKKFITENYKKSASDMQLTGAKMTRNGILKLECTITMKSGKKVNTVIESRMIRSRSGAVKLVGSADKVFKVESVDGSRKPFIFECTIDRRNVISAKKFDYSYNVKKEGIRYNVYGTHSLTEQKKVNRVNRKVVKESYKPSDIINYVNDEVPLEDIEIEDDYARARISSERLRYEVEDMINELRGYEKDSSYPVWKSTSDGIEITVDSDPGGSYIEIGAIEG